MPENPSLALSEILKRPLCGAETFGKMDTLATQQIVAELATKEFPRELYGKLAALARLCRAWCPGEIPDIQTQERLNAICGLG